MSFGQTCSVPDCSRKHYARGLCHLHYQRWWAHPETPVTVSAPVGGKRCRTPQEAARVLLERISISDETGCWDWVGARISNGYGMFTYQARRQMAHRVSYELFLGPIPEGLELDHLCRNRACINPSHLEPVTRQENVRRGEAFAGVNARKTHCIRGHEFTPENTHRRKDRPGTRECKTCAKNRDIARKRRLREATGAAV